MDRPNNYVYFCVGCAALNSVILGYDIGVAGGAMFIAQEVFTLSNLETEIILASLNLAAIPGAILARPVSDNLGRTKTLGLASSLFLLGSIIMSLSNSFWLLLFGRIITGVGVGTGLSIDPLYIAEISPAKYRGFLVSWSEGGINIGILLGFIVTYLFAKLEPDISWRLMFAFGGILPLVMLVLATFCMPETPRWLSKVGRIDQAQEVLLKICNTPVDAEQTMIEIVAGLTRRKEVSFRKLIWHDDRTIRFMVITVLSVAVAQQFSGVEAFMYYSPFLFQQVGFETKGEILGLTAMMGFSKTVTVFLVAGLLDTNGVGRRRLLLWSYVGMAISLFLLSYGAYESLRGLVVCSIFSYVVLFSVGAGPITWLFAAEILPTSTRASGMVLATTCNRLAGAAIGLTFLSASSASAGGALLFFAILCTLFAVFCYYYCPETQGKTLENMYAVFSPKDEQGRSPNSLPLSQQGVNINATQVELREVA